MFWSRDLLNMVVTDTETDRAINRMNVTKHRSQGS